MTRLEGEKKQPGVQRPRNDFALLRKNKKTRETGGRERRREGSKCSGRTRDEGEKRRGECAIEARVTDRRRKSPVTSLPSGPSLFLDAG